MHFPRKTTRFAFTSAIVGVLFAAVGHAQAMIDSALDARLQRLENELGSLRSENLQLRRELGLEGRAGQTMVKPSGREPVLAIGGLLQVQADALDKGDSRFTSQNDRFYLRRARINATGKFLEEFDFRVELEFANTFARTTSNRPDAPSTPTAGMCKARISSSPNKCKPS